MLPYACTIVDCMLAVAHTHHFKSSCSLIGLHSSILLRVLFLNHSTYSLHLYIAITLYYSPYHLIILLKSLLRRRLIICFSFGSFIVLLLNNECHSTYSLLLLLLYYIAIIFSLSLDFFVEVLPLTFRFKNHFWETLLTFIRTAR
jgi:hypothetical protein